LLHSLIMNTPNTAALEPYLKDVSPRSKATMLVQESLVKGFCRCVFDDASHSLCMQPCKSVTSLRP
jgi:hypothetical protein